MPDDMRDRLVRNFGNVIASGYFGGMGGLGLCLGMIECELNKILPCATHAVVWSECEVDSKKQLMLEAFTPEHAPKYLNDCIYSRLPDDVRIQIQKWTPSREVLLPAKLQANAKIKKVISKTYAERGHECNTAWCVKAHKVCPLEPNVDDPEWCRNVRLAAGGVPCFDVSSNGSREGDAGKSAALHHIWAEDIKHRKFSVAFAECTVLWDAEPMAQTIGAGHAGVEVVLSPPEIGDAVERRRRIVTYLNSEEAVVVRPLEDFLKYFGGECRYNFNTLFSSQDAAVDEEFERACVGRVMPVGSDDWLDTLLPSERARREEYLCQIERDIALAKGMEGDPSVFDLEVTPGTRSRRSVGSHMGANLFTMTSHGNIWHEHFQRSMTLEEWLGAHVVPTPTNPPRDLSLGPQAPDALPVPCDYMHLVRTGMLHPNTLKSAVGNGWHIGCLTSWIMFILASVEFGHTTLPPSMKSAVLTPPRKKRRQYASPQEMKAEEMDEASDGTGSTLAPQQTCRASPSTDSDSSSPWLQGTSSACFFSKQPIEIEDSPVKAGSVTLPGSWLR